MSYGAANTQRRRCSARVAILTDVHANLPALRATLAEIEEAGCDAIYCLGDVVGIGPYPAECLDLLLGIPTARFVMGNHDALFAFGLPDPLPERMYAAAVAHHRWTHAQLDPSLRTVVAGWPFSREETIGSVDITVQHYALDPTGRGFAPVVPNPTPADLDGLFTACRTRLLFHGHHHPTADVTGRARYVNPGSLGCSPDPLARYVVLEVDDEGTARVAFRAAPYDRKELIRQFDARQVPEGPSLLERFFGRAERRERRLTPRGMTE